MMLAMTIRTIHFSRIEFNPTVAEVPG